MSEVVNLRRFRKRKEREDKEHQSKQNRILHGTPKKLREKQSKIEALKTSRLDGKKFEGND